MTQLSQETIKLLKRLARIDCTEAEEEALLEDLGRMLGYFAQLDEVDTEGIAPCDHVLDGIINVFREDEVGELMPRAAFLSNAPKQTNGMIRVPQIMKAAP